MKLIDVDVAIKDADLNYGGVYDAVLVKYFLERQPIVYISGSNSDGCDFCNNKLCHTCVHCMAGDYAEPCITCCKESRNYEPTNYCPVCGKRLKKDLNENE